VGLIAREIEGRGVPTVSLSSALSITRGANPPRAAYLDFPLGHTSGKPHQPELNRSIVRDALGAFETLKTPGDIVHLAYEWARDDAWKDSVMRPRADSGGGARDDRVERVATPQYQTDSDRIAGDAALASGGCATCVWLDESANERIRSRDR
jgi:D-proline reductase (dithiol) PrdB